MSDCDHSWVEVEAHDQAVGNFVFEQCVWCLDQRDAR